jgi:topoisomerase-4 subunit A
MLSYDSRHEEPVCFPAKIPLLLMQGADGIAVGMATRVLPHNFVELLEAEIAYFEERPFTLLPDFIQGGVMDASQYDQGRGKVKLRAKIEVPDPKTIVITEVCYGTTTESLTRSIDDAAKRGKIKIESINDYTAEKVEIEIKLPRGQYAQDVIDELYAYTECEVSLSSQVVVIRENMPIETTVNELLILHANLLQSYLKKELEIEEGRLQERIFEKTLERIFIENRMYKKIEEISSYEKIHEVIAKSLEPFHKELSRIPLEEDRERLLSIPIRRISRFDLNKNNEDIQALSKELEGVQKNLKNVKKFTINYLKRLIEKYGKEYPRRTRLQEIEELDRRAIETKTIRVGFDLASGFVGTKVTKETFECTNFDKLLAFFDDGTYRVVNVVEKQYLPKNGSSLVHVQVADKTTVMSVVSKEIKTNIAFAKRFIVEKFILDKEYRYFEEGHELQFISHEPNVALTLNLVPKVGQKLSKIEFQMSDVLVKGVSAKGVKMSSRQVKKVVVK